ncbi:MFS transporter [Chromobacterium sinusclupearum]|uniref:MFS transporter n=1 Tax=Chromobacterium sinusclupearum TaxID=2077146 RepID=A0A2K4MR43_9NEIS|nr:MFS transporter [Chromobacterium sinusclupearum]POA99554.1 MFS transporter [Chromobacterium sinusclupearum]
MNETRVLAPERAALGRGRYFQFGLLLVAAGAIYPLLYLRQNFETTILQSFGITVGDLGVFYSMLGVVYALAYLPSGWLADRMSPRLLISFSLAAVGLLGLWFSTFPGYRALEIIFIGWGLAAGLTFWAALLKGVKMLAAANEQGRFFGVLDGGRGLVEALLATLALALFAYHMDGDGDGRLALQQVIYLYSFTCLAIAALIWIFLDKGRGEAEQKESRATSQWDDLKLLLGQRQVWLMSLIVLCGYQLFWATYSFSAYLQQHYGLSAVAAGFITVAKLWMRPIGGIGGGFLGDRFSRTGVLAGSMVFSSLGLFGLILLPVSAGIYPLLALVLLVGVLTYAIRGLYWSLLDDCKIPLRVTGLAIGLVSVIGYLPDIFLPLLNGWISARYPGVLGYQLYFGYIALCGCLGAAVIYRFRKSQQRQEENA